MDMHIIGRDDLWNGLPIAVNIFAAALDMLTEVGHQSVQRKSTTGWDGKHQMGDDLGPHGFGLFIQQ